MKEEEEKEENEAEQGKEKRNYLTTFSFFITITLGNIPSQSPWLHFATERKKAR